jgi:hypothetical protein
MAELSIADVIANHRRGSHVVILQIPFEHEGKKIEAVEVGPFTLDHRMLWRDGFYKAPSDLMNAVCADPISHKPYDPLLLRQLRNPDDERLEQTFMLMLPHEMRQGLIDKRWPGSLAGADVEPQSAEERDRIVNAMRRPKAPKAPTPEELDDEEFDAPMEEDRGMNIG